MTRKGSRTRSAPRPARRGARKFTKTRRPKNQGRGLNVRARAALNAAHRSYMNLIANPCGAPMSSALASYGGSVTERFRRTYTLSNGTSTCGYVIWFPTYHNEGARAVAATSSPSAYRPGNLVWFDNALSSYAPLNTTASPWGMDSAVATSGKFLIDPVNDSLTDNTAFSRGRTLSACLQLEYLGKTMDTSGQVAILKNASFASLDRAPGGTFSFAPPSVDDIFNHAAVIERTQLHGHEAIWRPSEDSSVLRDSAGLGANAIATAARADTAFWSGTAGTQATVVSSADPANAQGIVIAWRGFQPGVAVNINAVKVVELEVAARFNTVEAAPLSTKSAAHVDDCVAALDAIEPDWQLGRVVQEVGSKLGDLAIGAGKSYIKSKVGEMVNMAFAPEGSRWAPRNSIPYGG